jgi:symplekin
MKVENAQAQAVITPTATPPPPPPVAVITGPMTYGQLYTLSTDVAMTSFDGQQLPIDLVLQIIVGSINSLSQQTLQAAIAVCFLMFFPFMNWGGC